MSWPPSSYPTYPGGAPTSRGDCEFLHKLAHVHSDKRVGRVEKILRQLLGEVGLADAGRAKEHEHADRSVGILESDPVALDSLYHLGDCIV